MQILQKESKLVISISAKWDQSFPSFQYLFFIIPKNFIFLLVPIVLGVGRAINFIQILGVVFRRWYMMPRLVKFVTFTQIGWSRYIDLIPKIKFNKRDQHPGASNNSHSPLRLGPFRIEPYSFPFCDLGDSAIFSARKKYFENSAVLIIRVWGGTVRCFVGSGYLHTFL